ncbi:MAG: nucleotidyltransferase domain-containing protein [Acidobacteriota bacterium]
MAIIPDLQPVVDELLRQLGARLQAVVLFGSRARNDARPDSDIDLLVVADGLPRDPIVRLTQLRKPLASLAAALPGSLSIVARTPAEVESNLTPLLLDVCAEGICLFGDAYFQPLRTLARRALDQSGLRRQMVAGTLMWVFPQVRTPNWRLDWDGFHDGV